MGGQFSLTAGCTPCRVPRDNGQWVDVTGQKKALLIGINYRGTSHELNGCINDVDNQKSLLMEQYGFAERDIMLITEDEPAERRPTKEGILKGIQWLYSKAKSGDLLYFAYSGHGTQYTDSGGTCQAICPMDCLNGGWPGTLLLDTEIHTYLYDPLPTGCQAVAMFDCCHSATVANLKVKRDVGAVASKSRYLPPSMWGGHQDELREVGPGRGFCKAVLGEKYSDHLLWVMSGCQDDQTSADAYEDGMSQGAFTWGLIKSLKHDVFHSTYIDLLDQLKANLRGRGYKQVPALTTTHASYLTSWFVGQTPAPPMRALSEPPVEKKKALLVGINYRKTKHELNGCINDITNQKEALLNVFGFKEADVTTLSEDEQSVNSPTKARIVQGLKDLVKGAQPGDVLFFQYSGHGSRISDTTGLEPSGMSDCLIPLDVEKGWPDYVITDTEIHRLVFSELPEGAKMICLFDCCHSGTVANLDLKREMAMSPMAPQRHRRSRYLAPPASLQQPSTSTGGFLMCGHRPPSRNTAGLRQATREVAGSGKPIWVYSGCQDDQTSADAYEEGSYQGAFTWAFLQVLKQNSYSLHHADLLSAVRKVLRQKGFDQIPALSTTDQGNFQRFYMGQRRPCALFC